VLHQSATHVVGTIIIRYHIDMTPSSLASSISHQRRHSSSEKRNGMPRRFALSRCAPASAPASSACSAPWSRCAARVIWNHLMHKAGGMWEPGSRCWLIERRRIGPLIRKLQPSPGEWVMYILRSHRRHDTSAMR
jgi:hypothetical protein